MEEHREKILQSRTLKRKVVKLILSVLGQGIRVCRNFDEEVRAEFDLLPENFVLIIGIWGSRHPLILQSRKDGVHRIHESVSSLVKKLSVPQVISRRVSLEQPQETRMLEIRCKSVEAAWRMVTAKVSSSQAYARHDLLIKGEITKAMQMLRCIERVESYLFPKSIAKRVLPPQLKIPQKRWRMWIRMLHVGKIKPQRRKRAL
ncbi:hypothetical protein [Negativibacillus massiliensis]|uniref:hypothetical protein n=1 Tax=Negativibacillus massiliensis TaxID=1871035 RepID=UPI0003388E34|nr:hypothetical protein [Negativibacillus massiliensis]CDA77298.1 putative uncharacterized protein [Clostridium sp. CAG:242]